MANVETPDLKEAAEDRSSFQPRANWRQKILKHGSTTCTAITNFDPIMLMLKACLSAALLLFTLGAERAVGASDPLPPSAQAGWAEVEITPPLGIGLGGRGGPNTVATKVLDPLFAQVTYLKDAKGAGFVLVSFDVIGLPHDLSDRLRTEIVHESGVDWNLVVLNASHTHSGPYMIRSLMAGVGPPPPIEQDYFKFLQDKIILATRAAAKSLQPVKVQVFQGTSTVGINRRGKNRLGKRGIIPDPDGPFDDRVWVMKLTPQDGQAPAVMFSYACHPVIVYGYAFAAISADFPGVARNAIREALGPGSHSQFVQGFAGNIRPRITADLENRRFRASTPADLKQAGTDLAEAVLAAIKQEGQTLKVDLAGASARPFLPRGEPPPREYYEKLRTNAVTTTNNFLIAVSDYWLAHYDSKTGFARGDVWSLGLIRLAENQWIVHSAGEPCAEWRAKINDWLSPLNLVTWGYSQEAKSYLPTESLLPEGGYEVLESNQARASTPAPYAPGIEKAIRDSLRSQLRTIRESSSEK
jgi:neutral ceramidase